MAGIKIFIAWSTQPSLDYAKLLRDFLNTLPGNKDVFISEEIEKGSIWQAVLEQELSKASAGILVVTPENVAAPWIHFEAGVMTGKMQRVRVSPLLFDVQGLRLPLSNLQSTRSDDKDDFGKLMQNFLTVPECGANGEGLKKAFARLWDEFRSDVAKAKTKHGSIEQAEGPTPEEKIDEILTLVRRQSRQDDSSALSYFVPPGRFPTWLSQIRSQSASENLYTALGELIVKHRLTGKLEPTEQALKDYLLQQLLQSSEELPPQASPETPKDEDPPSED
ncbi:MAG: TIR domain-containing protein [Armatimonadetes bacterium]|nr:TIR domain-containing protein [Armatimonadota bacterium]